MPSNEHAVPNTAGTQPPRLATPPLACDCHMHIYDPARFPAARPELRLQPDAVTSDYRLLQARLGTQRTVVVQPAAYVTDNRVTLDAIARLGLADTRGVAVVHPDVTDVALDEMAAGGIRGIRFSVFNPETAAVRIGMIEPLAARMHERGWHVQLHMRGDQIADAAALLRRLPCRMVFDHIGRLPQPDGIAHPAFAVIRDLLEQGRAFVKLSGLYGHTRRAAALWRCRRGRARLHRGGAGPHAVGYGLAAPNGGDKARRRGAARPPGGLVRRRRGVAASHPGR